MLRGADLQPCLDDLHRRPEQAARDLGNDAGRDVGRGSVAEVGKQGLFRLAVSTEVEGIGRCNYADRDAHAAVVASQGNREYGATG